MSIYSLLSRYCSARRATKGFTLVELVVVSAIIIIITTFILLQQAKFNSSTLLRSLTYSVALTVRQAQTYGTSVRETTAGSNVFASGYGVDFQIGTLSQYILFPDLPSGATPGNGHYDSGSEAPPPTGPGIAFTLGQGYRISKLCAQLIADASLECTSGTAASISSLTVYFRRPNPDACFSTSARPSPCDIGNPDLYSAAYIQLYSTGNNDTRSIKVSQTGQISVCKPNLTDLTQC